MRLVTGADHGVTHELTGDFGRLGQAAAGHHRAAQGRGEGVTRAMNHVWQLLMSQLDLAGNTGGSAGHIVDDFAIAMVNGLQHHVLGTQLQQSTKQLVNRGLINILARIVTLGENACFGEVRHQHVGTIGQRAHCLAQLRCVRGVHFAGVSHHRVNQTQRVRIFAVETLNDRHLIGGAEEA